jgi:hypothetical protein
MLLVSTNFASLMFRHMHRHMHQGGVDRVGVRSGGCSQCIVIQAQWYACSSKRTSGLRTAALCCSCCERFFYLFRPLSKHIAGIWRSNSGSISCGLVSTSNEWPSRYPQRVASCELHLSIGAGLLGTVHATLFYSGFIFEASLCP